MEIGRIQGANLNLGAPADWDEARDGICGVLPVLRELVDGQSVMTSAWLPTPEEIGAIAAGAPIYLRVIGMTHPPVALHVGVAPE